jgi:hypothetical protein
MHIFTIYNSQKLKTYSNMMQVNVICQTLWKFLHRISNIFLQKNNLVSCSGWISFCLWMSTLICMFSNDMMIFDYVFRADTDNSSCFIKEIWVSMCLSISHSMLSFSCKEIVFLFCCVVTMPYQMYKFQ